jgi:hypothetical protein
MQQFFEQTFAHNKTGKVQAAVAISAFIRFALAQLPAPGLWSGAPRPFESAPDGLVGCCLWTNLQQENYCVVLKRLKRALEIMTTETEKPNT